jgi:hypothetical protein
MIKVKFSIAEKIFSRAPDFASESEVLMPKNHYPLADKREKHTNIPWSDPFGNSAHLFYIPKSRDRALDST